MNPPERDLPPEDRPEKRPADRHLEHLAEIRAMMEQSTRFLSLSGLAGVSTGLIALAATAFAWIYLDYGIQSYAGREELFCDLDAIPRKYTIQLGVAAVLTLIAALGAAAFFSARKARRQGLPVWNRAGALMLAHLAVPLGAGGLFCLVLLHWGICGLIAPVTLIFYGLALLHGSKYTLDEIRWLGLTEIALGLVSALLIRQSLLFWGLGFGVLHIVYGVLMYLRYER